MLKQHQDHRYTTERFLEAFDAAQAELGATNALMESALGERTQLPACVAIRRLIAQRMFRRDDDGRRCGAGQIAKALGVGREMVYKYIERTPEQREIAI